MRVLATQVRVLSWSVVLLFACNKEAAPTKKVGGPVEPDETASASPAVSATSSAAAVAVRLSPSDRFVVPHLDPCTSEPEAGDLLDDFEDGDNLLPRVGERNGSWYIAGDGTVGASIRPPVGSATPERIVPPRCQSNFGIHFAGRGFAAWGAVLGLNLRFDQAVLPTDLSGYRGIRFWARASEQNGCALRVGIDDASTHPNGGTCSKMAGQGHPCWNSFGVDIPTLRPDWAELFIPFNALTQKNVEPAAAPLDLSHTYQLTFKVSPTNPFDIWIDDVGFYR